MRTFPVVACCVAAVFLFLPSTTSYAQHSAKAIVGEPFGVGRLTVRLAARDANAIASGAVRLTERDGRVFYPALSSGTDVARLIGELLGADISVAATNLTVLFLFRGDEPLEFTLQASDSYAIRVVPRRSDQVAQQRLIENWWREYNTVAQNQIDSGDYPPLIQTYLTSMLGRRLGLQPQLRGEVFEPTRSELAQLFDLLAGTERMRQATMLQTLSGRSTLGQVADRPIPEDFEWELPLAFDDSTAATVEPMAMHVPPECFYVRFGSFENYLWLNEFLDEFGGDMSRMMQLRGHDAQLNSRCQRQLSLKQYALAEIFGGHVIADVALIGRDFYLREGAALGVLLEAKNSVVLEGDINRQRSEALRKFADRGAKQESLEIAGRKVSLLSTPDNHLRSFYAMDGDYHLVTTSRAIVERFFEVADGAGSLGASVEFQHARSRMPLDREDTVFIYLSSEFVRGLISPHYQIELARRLESVTDMELLQLARLAARAEDLPGDTIDELVKTRLLPDGFGRRPDGSGPILTDDGVVDSKRGARGSFLPIPDVTLRHITRDEESVFSSRAALMQNWQHMDPLVAGIKRYALDDSNQERVVIDANVSPLDEQKYGWLLSLLGPPSANRISSAPGDIINLQMSVRGGLLLPSISVHNLFLGVQDLTPAVTDLREAGFFEILRILRTTPGYLGAWPKAGFLDLLPVGILRSQPDAYGFSRLLLGVWRREFDEFSVLSFDSRLLANVTPHLQPLESPAPAQIRAQIGDLSQSNLTGWVTALNFQRAKQTTMGNVRLLNALTQQLRVPQDEAREIAERLLDVKLLCSLRGEYEPSDQGWQSTKLVDPSVRRVPADYEAPLLQWFRGLDLAMTKQDGQMMLHAHVDMKRRPTGPAIQLPVFSLFGGKKSKQEEKATEKVPAPVGGGKNVRGF